MSFREISSVLSSEANSKTLRPRANFHPSIWGDRFLNYDASDLSTQELRKQVEELKEMIRKELFSVASCDPSHQLELIDSIQRLGLSYHFEGEIEEALRHIHATFYGHGYEDLYDASLRFRLLRQHGFNVSCDTFDKFKDERGNFKECLVSNIRGMLSFYESSHLRLDGEDLLDEALLFTTTHLESLATQKTHPLSDEIASALKRPLRKSLERLQAKYYVSIYQDEHNKSLLELAKLDFNLVQSLHRKELSELSRWWKELDLVSKLPYARDRVTEIYVCWGLGVYFEPKYSLGRIILAKVCALTSVIDDTYDAYGTFEELELFTEAVQRWDIKCLDQLPEYMQLLYQTLLDLYQEFEEEMEEGESYRVSYAKEAMKALVRAYMDEARWLHQGHIPTLEEYLGVALVSSCHSMLSIVSFVGVRDNTITKDVVEWVLNDPKIVRASTVICRLMDDIVSHKFEQKRDHTPSAVECYIKQYEVSEQEAYDKLNKLVENAWKDTNEEFLRPTGVPMSILMRVLNFSRVIDLVYKEDDGYTHVGKVAKEAVTALLVEPIPY